MFPINSKIYSSPIMNFWVGFTILFLIAVIAYFVFRTKPPTKNEPFCNCFPIRDKRCPDPKVLSDLYNSGKLTEFTDFAKIEGSPAPWKIAMPDDYFHEEQKDCDQ